MSTLLPDRTLAARLARLGVRRARQAVRAARHPATAWRLRVVVDDEFVLVPVTASAAPAWFELRAAGQSPPSTGLAASPLGSALTSRDWVRRARSLRRTARAGGGLSYLIRRRGGSDDGSSLAGEAFAFYDGGTSIAELLVWLAGRPDSSAVHGRILLALTDHVLATTDLRRVVATIPPGEAGAPGSSGSSGHTGFAALESTLTEAGFVREGELHDPPHRPRAVWVRHRDAPFPSDSPEPVDASTAIPEAES